MVNKLFDTQSVLTDKQQEKQFWQTKNELCLKCIKKCKQSSRVSIINCKGFEGVDK